MLASVHSTAIYKGFKIAGECTSLIYYRGYQIRVKYILCTRIGPPYNPVN